MDGWSINERMNERTNERTVVLRDRKKEKTEKTNRCDVM